MKSVVVGIQEVDYISKQSGQPVKGVILHCNHKDPLVKGDAAEGIFVSDNLGIDFVHSLQAGDVIDIQYNNRGYVAEVNIITN